MTARILLADDNPDIRQLVETILAREGYEVATASDGAKAIEQISGEHFDAILLDLMMPVATGWDVLEWIKSNRPEVAQSCVIVLTAAIRELRELDSSTVYAVLTKPFELGELRSTVRDCIENRKR